MLSGPKICASRSSSASASAVAALGERARDAAGEAAREGDHPRRVALEELPVDARLVVVALEVAERAELDQVRVARVVGGEERQVRVALGQRLAVVDDVHLAAEDRLDALLGGGLVEVDRARHRAVVGERDGGHLELGRLPRERRDPARPVEDRVLGVDVQVDERRGHGKAIVVGGPLDRSAFRRSSLDADFRGRTRSRAGAGPSAGRSRTRQPARRTDNEGMRQMPDLTQARGGAERARGGDRGGARLLAHRPAGSLTASGSGTRAPASPRGLRLWA